MAHSFGVVEDKLREAEFFLNELRRTSRHSFKAMCFFSAFVSAVRSVTLAMQASLKGVPGFAQWYEDARERLKTDPLAPFFIEIRNEVVHTGINPLDQVTLDHLREYLARQLYLRDRSHVLVLPGPRISDTTILVDAVHACTSYFVSLVSTVYDCYAQFKTVVDPRWYFTEENFSAMNRSLEDAVAELGFPPKWATSMPQGPDAWKTLRVQQPACQANNLFERYLGRIIPDPDEVTP